MRFLKLCKGEPDQLLVHPKNFEQISKVLSPYIEVVINVFLEEETCAYINTAEIKRDFAPDFKLRLREDEPCWTETRYGNSFGNTVLLLDFLENRSPKTKSQ